MRVLLGVEDSKYSERALQMVLSQFRPQDTEVFVLHVVQPIAYSTPPQMSPQFTPELEQVTRQGRELVDRISKTLRDSGFRVQSSVEKGDIRDKIIDAAADWNADLIVLGSHGRNAITRFLLGSVAESVVRNAPCSVEIARVQAAN